MFEKKKKSLFEKIGYLLVVSLLLITLSSCSNSSNNDDDDDNSNSSGNAVETPTDESMFADWKGDWISHYTFMDGDTATAAFEGMALTTAGYSADDVKSVVKNAYLTDFGKMSVSDDSITFYDTDGTTELCTCTYEEKGDGTMSGEAAYKFQLKADSSDACQDYAYVLLQPLLHHESGEEHLHIRYGSTDFDELMEDASSADWWPILTQTADTTVSWAVEYMLEYADYYLSLLPSETSWPEGMAPKDRIGQDGNSVVQQADYDASGNLHVIFLDEIRETEITRHSVSEDVVGMKVVYAKKDAKTGNWTVEDIVSTPGSGERGASMAMDQSGVIHVVFGYREATVANTSLGYLNNSGGTWGDVTWIDGEKSGIENAYTDSGDRPKIKIASDGALKVAYAAWKKAMRLATFDGNSWQLEDVELTDDTVVIPGHNWLDFRLDSNDNPHMAYKCSDLEVILDETCSMTTAADGHPRVKIVGMHLRYAAKNETGWQVESVGESAGWTDKYLVTLGFTLADDIPYVITGYEDVLDGVFDGVKCARKTGEGWITDVIYDQPDAYYGWFMIGAETDNTQKVHISFCAEYKNGTEDESGQVAGHSVMYGVFDGRDWQVTTAVSAYDTEVTRHSTSQTVAGLRIGNSSDIAVDAEGNPSIIFRAAYEGGACSIGGIYEWNGAALAQ